MSDFFAQLQGASGITWVIAIACMALVWFLPAGLAYVFNRRHARLILIACVPAGFSFLAWGALLVWATTGKALEKYLPEKVRRRIATEPQS